MSKQYRHPMRVEIVHWRASGLWVWRGTVCGALCEGTTPRDSKEWALADAYDYAALVNSKGVRVVKGK